MRTPTITAHSGCEKTPRDSMASVEQALQLKADIVEVDVRIDGNGVLRVSHNCLSDDEYSEKATLAMVFARIADVGLPVNCDIKEAAALYDVLKLAEKFGYDRKKLLLSGCVSPEQLVRDPSITDKAAVYCNIEEVLKVIYLSKGLLKDSSAFSALMTTPWTFLKDLPMTKEWQQEVIAYIQFLNVFGINIPYRLLDEEFAESLHVNHIPISVWTVNQSEEVERCLQTGVANLTTLEVKCAMMCRNRLCGF